MVPWLGKKGKKNDCNCSDTLVDCSLQYLCDTKKEKRHQRRKILQLWLSGLPFRDIMQKENEKMTNSSTQDFSKGSVLSNIIRLAVPMTMAQLINVLYNIVDRIFIGRIPEHATLSLTGLGVCFPLITIVIAFANLVGMGGAPLFSIERGKGNEKEAEMILGNSFVMLVVLGLLLTVLGFLFKTPLLWLLGASSEIGRAHV